MSHVVIVFEPDPSCVDPRDGEHLPRRHAEFLTGDVLVLWRERIRPDAADGTVRTHLWGDGIFANVTVKEARKILRRLSL